MTLLELKILLETASVCCSDDTRLYKDDGRDGKSYLVEAKVVLRKIMPQGVDEYILVVS